MDLFESAGITEIKKTPEAIKEVKNKSWIDEYVGMPEYINEKPKPPEITTTFKFRSKEDFDSFMEIVKEQLYNGKRVFDGKQKKNEYSAWFPLPIRPSEFIYISTIPKCKYCDEFADTKGYRDNNGCVGSELVCFDCNEKTNKTLENENN